MNTWMVRLPNGLAQGPYETEQLKKLIGQGNLPTASQAAFAGGVYRPLAEWQVLAVAHPEAPRPEWGRPIAGLIVAFALAGVAWWWTAERSAAPAPRAQPVALRWARVRLGGDAQRADELRVLGEMAACEEEAAGVLRREPEHAAAWALLGQCAAANPGASAPEREALREAVVARLAGASSPSLLVAKGALEVALGRRDEARSSFEGALALAPSDVVARVALARMTQARDPGEASRLLAPALADAASTEAAVAFVDLALARGDVDAPWPKLQALLLANAAAPGRTLAVRAWWRTVERAGAPTAALAVWQKEEARAYHALLAGEELDDAARAALDADARAGLDAAARLEANDLVGAKAALAEVDRRAPLFVQYWRALVGSLVGTPDISLAELQGRLPGPLATFAVAALAREREANVRLEPLFGVTDLLYDFNPSRLPLKDGGLAALERLLAGRAAADEADRVLAAIAGIWLRGRAPEAKGALGEETEALLAGLAAFRRGQFASAARLLGPLAKSDDAAPAARGLYGRALEQLDVEAAEVFWSGIEEDEEDASVAELGHARVAAATGDRRRARDLAGALLREGIATPEVFGLLSLPPGEEPTP